MANGTDTLDEEQGQDFREPGTSPSVVPQPAMPQPRPMAAPVAAAPIVPPSINPQWSGAERLANVQAMGNAKTMAQAERAVKAAQLFQAQRGYQRDIASGMSAVEAGAKWGPLLFGATAGSANAVARMAAASRPSRKIVRGPGGQLFADTGTGALAPLTGAATPNPVTAVKQIPGNEAAIRKLEGIAPQAPGATTLPNDVFNAPFTPEGDVLRQRNFDIRQQVRPTITPSRAGPAPMAPTAVVPTTAQAPRAAPYSTAEQVKSAYQSGKLTRDAAKKILQEQFGHQ